MRKLKPNAMPEVRDYVKTCHVLQAIEEDKRKYSRKIKSIEYMIVDNEAGVYDSKDIFARAASIATGKEYTCNDFRGGMNSKYSNYPEKSDRVADVLSALLQNTEYHVTTPDTCSPRIKENINEFIIQTYINSIDSVDKVIEGFDREAITKERVNQSEFRKRLLSRFGGCCICNVKMPQLLVASHIKPWRESTSIEKVDTDNGLLLCPNHDRLFDGGYITFDAEGSIMISSALNDNDRMLMNVNDAIRLDMNEKTHEYITYHRTYIYRG